MVNRIKESVLGVLRSRGMKLESVSCKAVGKLELITLFQTSIQCLFSARTIFLTCSASMDNELVYCLFLDMMKM